LKRRTFAWVALLAVIAVGAMTATSSAMTNGVRETSGPTWMADVISNVGGILKEPVCSGAVVGDGWVLTAAHCVYSGSTKLQPRNFRVLIGRGDQHASNQGASYGVAQIVVMPGFIDKTRNDAALIQLSGFDNRRWNAMPLAFESRVANATGGVTLYGYGNYGWNSVNSEVGAGLLWKSPDGAFVQRAGSCGAFVCFYRTSSTRVMTGDSGGPWLRWASGAWQLIGVTNLIANASRNGSHDPAAATSTLRVATNGQTLLQWVRQTANLPVEPPNTIVRNSSTGNAWLVGSDGYREWIANGGDYLCLTAHGSSVRSLSQPSIDTIPDKVGIHASCATTPPPPPPPNHAEQQGHHGVTTFTNYHNASGLGAFINAGQTVNVSCKVYDPFIGTVNPDGYWYRIADSPWNNQYYAPANTFMNGDPWNGPYSHNTDFSVPNC
jgi:hypothetical protein